MDSTRLREFGLRDIRGGYYMAYVGPYTDAQGKKGVVLRIDGVGFSFNAILDDIGAGGLVRLLSEALQKIGEKITVLMEG